MKLTQLSSTQKRVVIESELGLHARPAAMITKIVQNAEKNIWIVDGNNRADASSVIDLLTLNAKKGNHLTLEIESNKDSQILDALVDFFESGFGENADGRT